MATTLRKQVLHGTFWSFIERFSLLGVQFIVSIILARILSPAEFGLIAMITVFTLLAQVVVESGFGQALIQKQNCSHIDESTVFWFNLFAGTAMTVILFLAAPSIAAFYKQPQLILITRVVSFNLLITSFGVVQNALLQKELLFRKRTFAWLMGVILSGVVGIAMALLGLGVWALVSQVLANNLIRASMLWVIHPWRPRFQFSFNSFRSLFRFSSNMLFSGLLGTIYDNIYLIIIGRIYSAADLGFYQRAKEFVMASSNTTTQAIVQVNFPILSKLQTDLSQLRITFRQIQQHALVIILPLMVGVGVCAQEIILVLLGEKWIPSISYLQVLCVIGALFPVHALNLNVLTSLGRSDLFFRLTVISKIMITISIVITYRFGIMAMLWGHVTCSIIGLMINGYFSKKILHYGLVSQAKDNIKTVFGACMAGGIVFFAGGELENTADFIALLLQLTLGAFVYLLLLFIMKESCFHGFIGNLKSSTGKGASKQ